MILGSTCYDIVGETLMARVGLEQYFVCMELSYAREMDFTGKSLRGLIDVDLRGLQKIMS